MRSLAPVLMGLALALTLFGCRKAPASTPEPTAQPAAKGPALQVAAPVVRYRAQETGALEDLSAGATITEVLPGANVVTDQGGRATLAWPDFLTVDQLANTDTLLGLSLSTQRRVVLDQGTGTARYQLQGAGEPANIQIKAAFTTIEVDAGTADFIVSLVPGDTPVAWLAVLDGEALVTRGTTVTDTLTVASGQAAGFVETGPLPLALDIDAAAVRAWYADYAVGTEKGTIATVALRCEVVDPVDMHLTPDDASDVVGTTIDQGEIVVVDGRNADASWVSIRPLSGRQAGWVIADSLSCTAPVTQAAVTEVLVAATPTPAPTRRVIVVSATPPLIGTPTSTPTATPTGAAYKINFWADRETITVGECTVLRWETDNIQSVYYEGKGVVGNGSSEECPDGDSTYELKVILRDGSTQIRTVTVKVKEAEATKVPPTNTSAPATDTTVPPTSPAATAEPSQTP